MSWKIRWIIQLDATCGILLNLKRLVLRLKDGGNKNTRSLIVLGLSLFLVEILKDGRTMQQQLKVDVGAGVGR
jgi:hypothetical protein